jgi:YD repeat-containing protein
MRYLFIISLLLTAMLLPAQNVTYSYDAAGNRTARVVTLLRSTESSSPVKAMEDIIAEHQIKIYPNPTKGMLSVDIGNLEKDIMAELILSDVTGRTISRQKSGSGTVYFNLSSKPSGIYILKIIIKGESVTWKVIKQ